MIILPEGSTTDILVYDLPPLGILAELNAQGGLARDRAIIVGYGVSSLGGMDTSEPDGVRKVATTRIHLLLAFQLMVGAANGNTDLSGICFGDSGGPLFLESDPDMVVAVASFARIGGCQAWSVHARIDTPSAVAFLAQYLTP